MRSGWMILAVLLAFSHTGQSQMKQEEKYFYGDGKSKPFDRGFDLLIPYEKESYIYFIALYKHKRNFSFSESLVREGDSLPTKTLRHEWQKINDSVFLKVKFRNDTAQYYSLLKPSGNYSLIIVQDLVAGAKDLVEELREELKTTGTIDTALNTTDTTSARKLFIEILEDQRKGKLSTFNSDYGKLAVFYNNKLAPLDTVVFKTEKAMADYKFPDTATVPADVSGLQASYRFLFKMQELSAAVRVDSCNTDSCDISDVIKKIGLIKKENAKSWVQGVYTLDELLDTASKAVMPADKAKKIENSIYRLNRYFLYLNGLLLILDTTHTGVAELQNIKKICRNIEGYLAELRMNLKYIKDLQKAEADIKTAMFKERLFMGYNVQGFDTYIYSFETRNKLAITPVFGYAYYGFQKGFSSFTPYLGFQVNFSSLNREDPFRLIPKKTLWQRLCFTTAWTLTEIGEQNKRADLFGKSSLITSLGYKLSHVLMLNAGGMWFKQEDPSPAKTTKKIAITPVLSLSLNLEIEQLLNGFTKLIPIK